MKWYYRIRPTLVIILAIAFLWLALSFFNVLPKSLNIVRLSFVQPVNKAMVLKEVKAIGELNTAQFYGEVFADLNSVYISLVKKYKRETTPDSLYTTFPKFKTFSKTYNRYIQIDSTLKNKRLRKARLKMELDTLEQVFAHTQDKFISKTAKRSASDKLETNRQMIAQLASEIKQILPKFILAKQHLETLQEKRNLIYIGRGKVRAGFDFEAIIEKAIILKNLQDTVQIELPSAQILSTNINPWYLQDKIKGFELFDSYGGSFTNDEVTAVRLKCIEQLKKQAIDKGILKHAEANGKRSLSSLFAALKYQPVKIHFTQN